MLGFFQACNTERHWSAQSDAYHMLPEVEPERFNFVPELDKDAVLGWLRNSDSDELKSVLKDLASEKRALFESVLCQAKQRGALVPEQKTEGRLLSNEAEDVPINGLKDVEMKDFQAAALVEAPSPPLADTIKEPKRFEETKATSPKALMVPPPTKLVGRMASPPPKLLAELDSNPDGEMPASGTLDEDVIDVGADLVAAHKTNSPSSLASPSAVFSSAKIKFQTQRLLKELGHPVVQFSAFEYFCMEGDPYLTIEVMRIGDLDGYSEVQYTTLDGTAKQGSSYKETRGKLIFEPGENEKTVQVPLIDDDFWRPTVEFSLNLLSDGIVNAALGRYLWATKVIIIDNDTFPTNEYKADISKALETYKDLMEIKLTDVSMLGLMAEFWKLMWTLPDVMKGSVKTFIVDQLHNIYLIQKLFMNVFLVDVILKKAGEEASLVVTELVVYMAAMIGPFTLLHYLDYTKFSWRVRGITRKTIQAALMRKFLNYDAQTRANLNHGALIMAITRDAVNIIDFGYMNMFTLAQALGSIILMFVYQFMSALIFHKPLNYNVILPMLFYPGVFALFIKLRQHTTTAALKDLFQAQDKFVTKVDTIVQNYPLIIDYNVRSAFVSKYEDSLMVFNKQAIATGQTQLNNKMFSPWLALIAVGIYTIFGGVQVVEGALTLGSFLVNVKMFTTVGDKWGQIYMILSQIQSCIPNLERITVLMNYRLDVPSRMQLSNFRRMTTQRMRFELRKKANVHQLPIDMLPVRIPLGNANGGDVIDLVQGHLVYIVGPHGEGKSMLLRLISMVAFPLDINRDPPVFVPSHLRALHVPSEPLFFQGTLLENLSIGIAPGDSDGSIDRILEICRRLGLPSTVLDLATKDQAFVWSHALSQTQRQLLSLGRALIANPEFLCISKAMQLFDSFTIGKVLELLKDFVVSKGIEQDPDRWHLRRPRTCILTANQRLSGKFADQVLHCSIGGGIRLIKKGKDYPADDSVCRTETTGSVFSNVQSEVPSDRSPCSSKSFRSIHQEVALENGRRLRSSQKKTKHKYYYFSGL